MDHLDLGSGRLIPLSELRYQVSTSGGPGGQHANKTSSRVTVYWNLEATAALSDQLKARLIGKLSHRLTSAGELQLHVDTHRSQHMNRATAHERLTALLIEALKVPKARQKTKPTRGSKMRRLDGKKRRGDLKKGRSKPRMDS